LSRVEEIHEIFTRHGYQWKIDGELRSPTVEDIKDTLDRMADVLYDEEDGAQLEVGRLIAKRHRTGIVVYILIGEENAKDS
jgi:hypothetical protein